LIDRSLWALIRLALGKERIEVRDLPWLAIEISNPNPTLSLVKGEAKR